MKLNIGCGENWRELYPSYEGLDKVDYGQRYICNIFSFQSKNRYEEIIANHFFEHFTGEEIVKLLNLCWEWLKKNGILKICVPHKCKNKAWVIKHKTFFTKETFLDLETQSTKDELGLKNFEIIFLKVNKRKDIHCHLKKI